MDTGITKKLLWVHLIILGLILVVTVPRMGELRDKAASNATSATSSCPLKSIGDANCDGAITLSDFESFRREFTGQTLTKDSDFNGDGRVSFSDFEIWRVSFTQTPPTLTSMPTPSATNAPTATVSPGASLTCSSATTLESLITCITSHFGPFVIPNSSNLADWKTVVTNMLSGQCNFVSTGTLASIYQIKTFTDTVNGKSYCVAIEIRDTSPADGKVDNGWGTFIVNNTPSREVNHSAPHATSDVSTENQAVGLFKSTDSRTYLMSGASRNIGTGSCQSNLGYAASDASHNIDHFFFDATEVLAAWYGTRAWWQIQWHGAAVTTCSGVNAYISHGFSSAPPADSKTVALKQNIKKYHPTWTATVPGDTPSCSLNATNNVEGRFLNGVPSSSSCQTSATTYRYKFIHVEQQPGYRNDSDWHQAIVDTFP